MGVTQLNRGRWVELFCQELRLLAARDRIGTASRARSFGATLSLVLYPPPRCSPDPGLISHVKYRCRRIGHGSLAVLPNQVVDTTDGRATNGGVVSMMVVEVQPSVKGPGPGGL